MTIVNMVYHISQIDITIYFNQRTQIIFFILFYRYYLRKYHMKIIKINSLKSTYIMTVCLLHDNIFLLFIILLILQSNAFNFLSRTSV